MHEVAQTGGGQVGCEQPVRVSPGFGWWRGRSGKGAAEFVPAERGRTMLADGRGVRASRSAFIVDSLQVAGAHRGPFQGDDAATLEDAVDDGLGQVVVVQGGTPVLERLVGGEQ